MYIVLEGVVGTGKSTQSHLLVEYLKSTQQKEVIQVREPGGTEISEKIRTLVQGTEFEETMDPLTDIYLYASARAQLLMSTVLPALQRGDIVVSDRCFCSSLAIQGVAQGAGVDLVWKVNKPLVDACMPDIVFFLDVDVDVGLKRIFDYSGDKFEKREKEFSYSIYEGYTSLFSFEPTKHIMHRLDASGTIEEIHAGLVSSLLELGLLASTKML